MILSRFVSTAVFFTLALLSLVTIQTRAGLADAGTIALKASDFRLANGLELVVVEDHRAPVVTHMVWYRVGSADEPQGKAGIAHFLEHLMFKGTAKHGPGTFSAIVRENGGEENAFTAKDYTAYYQRIAKDRLPLMMELEADRMQNLTLTDEVVRPELDVVLEERRSTVDSDPMSLLGEQISAALYLAHPYGRPIIGWMGEVSKLTRDDAIAFYKTYYTPANAIVIVAGDVKPDEVKALADKYYGGLQNTAEVKPRQRTPEPDAIAARRVAMTDPRAYAPTLQRVYSAPSYVQAHGTLKAESLDLLSNILGGGSQSRLYKELVLGRKLAIETGAGYSGDAVDQAEFSLYAAPVAGADLATLESAIDAVLAEIVNKGVTAEELEQAKNDARIQYTYQFDNQGNLARMIGVTLVTGGTLDDVRDWINRINRVTPDDVNAAAREILDLRRSVTATLTPPPGAAQTQAPQGSAVAPSEQN